MTIEAPEVEASERRPGGDASTTLTNDEAFGQSPDAIRQDFSADANFKSGNQVFRNDHEGEGPLLNARTCQGCHTKDGRGAIPADTETPMDSMSIRLSLGNDGEENPVPDPNYGVLLQTFGLASFGGGGIEAGLASFDGGRDEAIGEGFAYVTYELETGSFPDGEDYELRRPVYHVRDLSYGDFDDGVLFSARVAPQLIGMGLLGAVPEEVLRERDDPEDEDGDGISGRANETLDLSTGEHGIGRFGYKASTASPLHQVAAAYRNDMGVTSLYAVEEACAELQESCRRAAMIEPDRHPGGVDISDVEMALVEFYVRLLAVPERRGYDEAAGVWEEDVLRGRTLFFESGVRVLPPLQDGNRQRRGQRARPGGTQYPVRGCRAHRGAFRPGHPSLYGPAVARHGRELFAGKPRDRGRRSLRSGGELRMGPALRRPGRRAPRAARIGKRMAHGAPLGPGSRQHRQSPSHLPARRTRQKPDRSHPLARRRGGAKPRELHGTARP